MKFTVSLEQLSKVLVIASKGISTRATLPILSALLLELEDNILTITGSNTEVALKVTLDVKGVEDGIFALPAKLFTDYVSTIPHGVATIETGGDRLKLVCGTQRSEFTGLPYDEYPALNLSMQPAHYTLPIRQMIDCVDRVSFAASSDDARAILTGVSLKVFDGVMEIAATDGFRLSVEKFTSDILDRNFAVVLPAKVVQEVAKILRESSGNNAGNFICGLSIEGTQFIFSLPSGVIFMTRLLEGTFPPYNKIIPTSYATKLVLKSDEFIKLMRTASLFARSGSAVVKMSIESSTSIVKLSSETEQVGTYSGEMIGVVEGSDNSISFNSKYLLDFLSKIKTDDLVFEMNGVNQPGVWRIPTAPEFLHVVMPIRSE